MLIGVPKEIKPQEFRVGLTPSSVRELIYAGHRVIVETQCGVGIGASDAEYETAGAQIASQVADIFKTSDMIVKVKEPQAVERKMLREGQILYTYLHLAPDPDQTRDLIESGAICIAYETVTDAQGRLPLLTPMSQVAGRMSVQAGAHSLEASQSGSGILLGGVPGVAPAHVVVIGGGVVGENAVQIAAGMGAHVTVLDRNVEVLAKLSARFGPSVKTLYSHSEALEQSLTTADLVIGGVLVKGAKAPKLVTRDMLSLMSPGSVLVDVAIDQGGCFETSKATTHLEPTYIVDDVVHYCVANMPGAVPKTSTYALNNVTLPHALSIANKGYKSALLSDPHLREGLNVIHGKITCEPVAKSYGADYVPAQDALN